MARRECGRRNKFTSSSSSSASASASYDLSLALCAWLLSIEIETEGADEMGNRREEESPSHSFVLLLLLLPIGNWRRKDLDRPVNGHSIKRARDSPRFPLVVVAVHCTTSGGLRGRMRGRASRPSRLGLFIGAEGDQ